MAAKGAESKNLIIKKIFEAFPGAFFNGKELRIPLIENDEEVQIKVGLTAAKENVEHETAIADASPVSATINYKEPDETEQKNIATILAKLGVQ